MGGNDAPGKSSKTGTKKTLIYVQLKIRNGILYRGESATGT